MEIHILAKQGKGIREISRMTGHSRNTVRRCLRSAAWPSYKKRPPRPEKLDPYKKYLEERWLQEIGQCVKVDRHPLTKEPFHDQNKTQPVLCRV